MTVADKIHPWMKKINGFRFEKKRTWMVSIHLPTILTNDKGRNSRFTVHTRSRYLPSEGFTEHTMLLFLWHSAQMHILALIMRKYQNPN
jgi:hypothetical protein